MHQGEREGKKGENLLFAFILNFRARGLSQAIMFTYTEHRLLAGEVTVHVPQALAEGRNENNVKRYHDKVCSRVLDDRANTFSIALI